MSEGQGYYGLGGGPDDEQRDPHPKERREGPKRCVDVRVVPPWSGDGSAKLGIAKRPEGWQETAHQPYY